MARRLSSRIVFIALLVLTLTGCQSMSSPSFPDGFPSRLPDGGHTNVGAEWPLKFRAHYFRAVCYSTYGCRVHYGSYYPGDDPDDVLQIPSSSVSNYPNNLQASWGPFPNFPPPAKVTWRSRDGQAHEADIDIGGIFKDQLIRHHVAREDATDPATDGMPEIILEVNDRTINVYMRATIWTKKEQIPGNRYSEFRDDLIQVFSQTY